MRAAIAEIKDKAANVKGKEQDKLMRAANAYGSEADGNNVFITTGNDKRWGPAEARSGAFIDTGDGQVTGFSLVTIGNTSSTDLTQSLASALAHEGDHVANNKDFVDMVNASVGQGACFEGNIPAAWANTFGSSIDLTQYQDEHSAFTTTSIFLQASNFGKPLEGVVILCMTPHGILRMPQLDKRIEMQALRRF